MTTKHKLIRTVSFLTAITLLGFSALSIYAAAYGEKGLKTSAKAAALYNPETESFLYTKNACARLPMASTTKIMTALVVLENTKLNEEVIIYNEAVGIEGSSAYLKSGDIYTVEELLYALLLRSANDAAVAAAGVLFIFMIHHNLKLLSVSS